ncbi:unnamed protein product [Meloidogyne enterolobii]|uniref:Uncharacterized protein n=1 Tax=Meloidogyne enterolobii TaxID=390850 RepID=A0ACB0Y155_MELEN
MVSVEFPIPTEIHVFQEIASEEDIHVSHEEVKEEIVCSKREECFVLEKVSEDCVDLKELEEDFDLKKILEEKVDEKECLEFKLEVFEKDPEKEILPSRDKLKVLKENENIVEKRKMLRSKLRESRILAKLKCEILRKEIVRNNFGKDFECGFLKRKITGRFFLGVRGCLNSEKLVTLIGVFNYSENFSKEMNHQMQNSKPMKVLEPMKALF